MITFVFECQNCGEHPTDESTFREAIRVHYMRDELDQRLRDGDGDQQARLVFEVKCPVCDPQNEHTGTLKVGKPIDPAV